MKRVAIYARVSTAEQNADMQVLELQQYASSKNYEVVGVYLDTVTGNVDKRMQKRITTRYDALLEDCRAGKVDVVLVWKYDRFARSLIHLILALEEFKKLGIDFISYTQHIDTTTPHGKLFFHMVASFAEFERGLISERTKAGLRLAVAKGVKLGPKEKFSEAKKSRLIQRYTNGETCAQIAKAESMSPDTVYAILRRTVCRVKCPHGRYRCHDCREPNRVPTGTSSGTASRNLGQDPGLSLGPIGVRTSN